MHSRRTSRSYCSRPVRLGTAVEPAAGQPSSELNARNRRPLLTTSDGLELYEGTYCRKGKGRKGEPDPVESVLFKQLPLAPDDEPDSMSAIQGAAVGPEADKRLRQRSRSWTRRRCCGSHPRCGTSLLIPTYSHCAKVASAKVTFVDIDDWPGITSDVSQPDGLFSVLWVHRDDVSCVTTVAVQCVGKCEAEWIFALLNDGLCDQVVRGALIEWNEQLRARLEAQMASQLDNAETQKQLDVVDDTCGLPAVMIDDGFSEERQARREARKIERAEVERLTGVVKALEAQVAACKERLATEKRLHMLARRDWPTIGKELEERLKQTAQELHGERLAKVQCKRMYNELVSKYNGLKQRKRTFVDMEAGAAPETRPDVSAAAAEMSAEAGATEDA